MIGAVGWSALGALALPGLVRAQAPKVYTVAVLFVGDSDDDEPAARPFFDEMEKLGWIGGKNLAYDRHSGKGTRQYLESLVSVAVGRGPPPLPAPPAPPAPAGGTEN